MPAPHGLTARHPLVTLRCPYDTRPRDSLRDGRPGTYPWGSVNLVTDVSTPHLGLHDDPSVLDGLHAVIAGERSMDQALLRDTGAVIHLWARAFPTLTPAYVLGPLRTYVNILVCLIDGGMTATLRARAGTVLADAALFTAFLSSLQVRHGETRAFYGLARDAAQEAGNRALLGHALAGLGSLYSTIPHNGARGDAKAAVALLQQADVASRDDAPPVTVAYVASTLAVHLAAAGDARGHDRAMMRATRALAEVRGDPRGRQGFTGADGGMRLYLEALGAGAVRARGAMLLDRPDAASALTSSVHRLTHPGQRTQVLADLAWLHLRRGELDEACRCAGRAVDDAREAAIPLHVWRVRSLRGLIRAPASHPAVRALDARLEGWP